MLQPTQPPTDDPNVRQPAVAGTFYLADPAQLTEMVDYYLNLVPRVDGDPTVLIVPHAGYVYSGVVAAYGFRQIQGVEYDAVVILGTNHQAADFTGLATWAHGAWATPLGQAPIDEELAAQLLAADARIVDDHSPHINEHSIEVQLPFLQRACPDCSFVPVMIGQPTTENIEILSAALTTVLADKKALIIVSTDLSHYPAYDDARWSDGLLLNAVETRDPNQVLAAIDTAMNAGVANLLTCACGEGPLLVGMTVAQRLGADDVKILAYANSGDVPGGDQTQVVGYGAVMFWDWEPYTLTEADQTTLLQLARDTIAARLSGATLPTPPTDSEALQRRASVFVTLTIDDDLRGCIGDMSASRTLGEAVQYAAQAAAFEDPRFNPLTAEELAQIDIEISVLSPLHRIQGAAEVEIGAHGLVIRAGGRSGLLLPQVATERNWTPEQFLEAVSRKAGLAGNAWQQSGTALYTFSALVFGETE